MSKNAIIRSIVFLALIIGVIIFVWLRFFYFPDQPEGVLHEPSVYLIKPETILVSLDRGETGVFLPAPPEPEEGWPQLQPPGSLAWGQEEYMKVANALHQFVWNESLAGWYLIRAYFRIDQCRNIFGRIDSVDFSFFRRQEGWNVVHGFWINPLYGFVETGNEYSYRTGWTAKWKGIELDKVKIGDVNAALLVAEENGGSEARTLARNECGITLLLDPEVLEYSFLSHPFTHYGWGWRVIYWPNQSNADPIFGIIIDPYTGKYRILTPAR